jgi:hypothetical protein
MSSTKASATSATTTPLRAHPQARRSAAGAQDVHHIGLRGVHRRRHAEDGRCRQPSQRRECQHRGIDGDGIEARQVGRRDDPQFVDAEPRQSGAEERAEAGQHQRLGEHLARQAPPASTQSGAHRQLAGAQRRPHQQEIGHVGAGDQQKKNRRAHQRQDGRPDLRHQVLLHRLQPHMPIRRPFNGELPLRLGGEGVGFGLRLFERDARLQPADHPERDAVALGGVIGEARRGPDIGRPFHIGIGREEQLEARRQHAHHLRTGASGHLNGVADDGGVAAKAPLEILVAQDGDDWQTRRRWRRAGDWR